MDNNQFNESNLDANIPSSILNSYHKNELLQFKNEILNDIKKSQKLGEDKLDKFIEIMETKFAKYDKRINMLSEKYQEISNNKPENNVLTDHVKDLLSFKTETKQDLITINIKLENLEKDIYNNAYRIDKILTESVIYPGIIGNTSKFKTFHDFMDYLLAQTFKNITFRDKSEMDLKSYKNKMDKYLKIFSAQLENSLKESNIFTKKNIEEVELKMKSLFGEINDKIQSTRVDNTNIINQFEKVYNDMKQKPININSMKEEIDKIIEEKIFLIQEENNQIIGNCLENKTEINLIKDRLNQLSDFIKDIKPETVKYQKKGDAINLSNKKVSNKNDIKYESKIKKYIHGEINAKDLGAVNKDNNNNISNNRTANKYHFNEEKINSISNSNINNNNSKNKDLKKSDEFTSKSINNIYNSDKYKDIIEYNNQNEEESDNINTENKLNSNEINNISITNNDTNKNQKKYRTKYNINKKEINTEKDSYDFIKNGKIPKTTKIIKNSRKDKNINKIKNKQITYNKLPKNRNPKEKNKNRKKLGEGPEKELKNLNKEEYETEENEEEEDENKEELENEEGEIEEYEKEEFEEEDNEEESFDNNNEENFSCDDVADFSDSEEDSHKENISMKKNKMKKKLKGKISKIVLTKVKANKRGSSAKISKIKILSNNKNNWKTKEKKIKYINSKSRNNNIKNHENIKENISKKNAINKKKEISDDNNKLFSFQKYKEENYNLINYDIHRQYNSEYKNNYEKEYFNGSDNKIKKKLESYYKSSEINKNKNKNVNDIKIVNESIPTKKINNETSYQQKFSKFKDEVNISYGKDYIESGLNNNDSEMDIKQIEIKNLNRNIKNYIKNNFKLKDKYNSSLNNNSVSRYLSYDRYHKNDLLKEHNKNEMNNSSDFNRIQNYNYNDYSNIKSRNKIVNKNNKDIVNNLNENMNVINIKNNNTYHYMPKMFNDFDIYTYKNNQYMTIDNINEYYNTFNLNENINDNKSTIIRKSNKNNNYLLHKIFKNNSATNIYFTDKIKFKNDRKSYKNKNYKNNIHKIKKNFSSEIGNNKSNPGFSNSNNNSFSINNINNKDKNNLYENTNNFYYYNNDQTKNLQLKKNLEKLDNNIIVNEQIINSPIQIYQTYQKNKKDMNFKINHPLKAAKNILFNNNNETVHKNVNNDDYSINILNIKAKEANLIQNLIYKLQYNIQNHEKKYDNEKNKTNKKN